MSYAFYESGLSINVMYSVDPGGKRAVGFKLSEGMDVPDELSWWGPPQRLPGASAAVSRIYRSGRSSPASRNRVAAASRWDRSRSSCTVT